MPEQSSTINFFLDEEHLALRHQVRSWVEKSQLSAEKKEIDAETEARRLIDSLAQAAL
jgi:hypothetical protein